MTTPIGWVRSLPGLDRRILPGLRPLGVDARTAVAAARSIPRLAGRGASLGILVEVNARGSPDRPALIDDLGMLSWRELNERVDRLACALAGLGIAPGMAVATLLRNGREQAETILAAQKLGLTTMPLNTWATPRQLLRTMAALPPTVLVYDVRHAGALPDPMLGFVRVAVGGDPPAGSVAYEHLVAEGRPRPPSPLTLHRRPARIVLQTSGTTGLPKGAARATAGREGLALLGILATIPVRRGDVIDCPAPLFHAFGLLALSMWLALGATLVLPDRFEAAETMERIEEHRADALVVVPAMLHRLVSLPARARPRGARHSVRLVLSSGSALSPGLRRRAGRLFGDRLYDLYGSTEVGWVAVATPSDAAAAPGAVGRPVPGVRVSVLGADGRPVPTGVAGRIHVRSAVGFDGYVGAGRPAEEDEPIDTHDLGWLDQEGRLHLTGRADEVIVVGGENVHPREVEEVIEGVEGVEAAAVTGIPDPDLGTALAAHVQPRPGARVSRAAVLAACRRELPPFKVPRRLRMVERLPRTATGKVLRRDLAAAS